MAVILDFKDQFGQIIVDMMVLCRVSEEVSRYANDVRVCTQVWKAHRRERSRAEV